MITEPSIEELKEDFDSLYTLVILAAKRARHLNVDGDKFLDEYNSKKPVSMSLEEIGASKITYEKNIKNPTK